MLRSTLRVLPFLLGITPAALSAQQPSGSGAPVASVSTQGVTLHGVLSVADNRATLGNNGEITAGDRTAPVSLARGGQLLVCASTSVHIAKDVPAHGTPQPGDAGLLISLDRGAIEGHYTPGAYADEILTPDLRLLISRPGVASLKLRVNADGDTCVDNTGANAPYVVASSLADAGVYRIQPNQRVLFVHGSLSQVVDNEHEPCGCPPAVPEELANTGKQTGNEFPLAVSEGLQAPPKLSGPPIVPEGVPHAQVTATLSSSAPPGPPPATAPASAPAPPPQSAAPQTRNKPHRGFFGNIGHFFARVFGSE